MDLSTYRRLTFFWHDVIKQVAIEGLRHLQLKFNICLVGYVIMPEHIHALIYPHPRADPKPIPISILLHAFKRKVGQEGKKILKHFASEDRLWAEPILPRERRAPYALILTHNMQGARRLLEFSNHSNNAGDCRLAIFDRRWIAPEKTADHDQIYAETLARRWMIAPAQARSKDIAATP